MREKGRESERERDKQEREKGRKWRSAMGTEEGEVCAFSELWEFLQIS